MMSLLEHQLQLGCQVTIVNDLEGVYSYPLYGSLPLPCCICNYHIATGPKFIAGLCIMPVLICKRVTSIIGYTFAAPVAPGL